MKEAGIRRPKGRHQQSDYQKRRGDNLAASDEDEYSVYERKYQNDINHQQRRLLEAGLNLDHNYTNNNDTTYK